MECSARSADGATHTAALAAARGSLVEIDGLLAALSDAQYAGRPVGVFESSIGGHVRHVLDHFQAWLAGAAHGEIDYDRRERDTPVEAQRSAARRAIAELLRGLDHEPGSSPGAQAAWLDLPLRVASLLSADGPQVWTGSTLGRELTFVLSHTVHHNAIIAAMARTLGVPAPPRFGYAPATLAHLERGACAR